MLQTVLLCFMTVIAFVMPFSLIKAEGNYPDIDTGQKANITLVYEGEGTTFQLYQIAFVSDKVQLSLNGKYQAYSPDPIKDFSLSQEEWMKLADQLSQRLRSDKVTPEYTAKISGKKALLNNIPLGLYLLVGDSVTVNHVKYHPIPTFIMVPEYVDDSWNYTFEAEPKKWTEPVPTPEPSPEPDPKTVTYSVTKKWERDNVNVRPKEVTIAIRKGNTVVRSVVLNESNKWTYSWSDQKDGIAYSVSEPNVPDHYSVVISGNATSFVMTNVYQGTPPPSPWTGDLSDMNQWMLVFGAGTAAALVTGFILIRSRRES